MAQAYSGSASHCRLSAYKLMDLCGSNITFPFIPRQPFDSERATRRSEASTDVGKVMRSASLVIAELSAMISLAHGSVSRDALLVHFGTMNDIRKRRIVTSSTSSSEMKSNKCCY